MEKQFTAMLASAAVLALMLSGCQTDSPAASGGSVSGADGSAPSVSSSQAVSGSVQPESQLPKNELCFMDGAMFTKMTEVKKEEYEDGTYWYEDRTEDGFTTITNRSFPTDPNWKVDGIYPFEETEEKIIRKYLSPEAWDIECYGAGDDSSVKGDALTSYVYWNEGRNEDTKRTLAVFALTDDYTYVYSFENDIEYFDDMVNTYLDILDRVQLKPVQP